MASIIKLLRAPRYGNLSYKEIRLIESFLQWRKEVQNNTQYASPSFEKWCGHSESELPPFEAIVYFTPYFDRPFTKSNDINGYVCGGIFEQMARMPKASQFLNWFATNVVKNGGVPFSGKYEVTQNQLEQLLEACTYTRRYGLTCIHDPLHTTEHYLPKYTVNKHIAKAFLPIMEHEGHLSFPYRYESLYAEQVLYAIKVLNEILATTNFEKQTIYVTYG